MKNTMSRDFKVSESMKNNMAKVIQKLEDVSNQKIKHQFYITKESPKKIGVRLNINDRNNNFSFYSTDNNFKTALKKVKDSALKTVTYNALKRKKREKPHVFNTEDFFSDKEDAGDLNDVVLWM